MPSNEHPGVPSPEVRLALLATALSHPERIGIVKRLAEHPACVRGAPAEEFPFARSTAFEHLRELKAAGLVQGEIEGPETCYCLDPKAVSELQGLLTGLFLALTPGERRCC